MLPESILLEAQKELLNWRGLGMSVMEIGHRSAEYKSLMEEIEADLRELISIPDHYEVLFLGGAARTHFAMVPMNFLSHHEQAGYWVTGLWSQLAYKEASKLKQSYLVASTESSDFTTIPRPEDWQLQENTAYLYYTPNETVNGVRFNEVPRLGGLPLVADMTSCLLSEPIQVSDFALIFAGAQKNIANAGLTLVILRSDLLEKVADQPLPSMMDYRLHVKNQSLFATPPTFNCYLAGKMFQWVKAQGGVEVLYHLNRQKSAALYQYIDASSFYHCAVEKEYRSLVNVCFSLVKQELEKEFLMKAKQRGLCSLQGHRAVGGLRASLYNAMPMAGVESLIEFMDDFSREHRP